jgi:hypothetical protein
MGGGSQDASSSQHDITPPEYTALRDDFASVFGSPQNLAPIQNLSEGYQGSYGADITPEEQGLVNQISGFGGASVSPAQQAAMDARMATLRGENLNPTEQFKPWVTAINEAFDEGTLQNAGMFTGAGHAVQESSPFARSEAIREKARVDAIAKAGSDIYLHERDLQEQAAAGEESQAAARRGIDAAEIQNLVDRLSATQLPRLIADMGIERGMAQFNQEIQNLLNLFGMGVQASMPQLATSNTSSGSNWWI